MTRKVAILGGSGYTGRELLRLLAHHPHLEVHALMSARPGATPTPPELPVDPVVDPFDADRLAGCDGVFLGTPHGAAAPLARIALDAGCRVVDLSADFRLSDPAVYARTYGAEHPATDLLDGAVYGLSEHARERVAASRLVANPGCYPTSILLPLIPLHRAGLLADDTIVADSKSGASGAGGQPKPRTVFGAVHDNFLAYGVGTHRHTPEIHAHLGSDRVVFVPHLLPVFRGILSTLYLPPAEGVRAAQVRACLAEAYAGEPFVTVFERGMPELDRVQRTNECHIAVADAGDRVVAVSCIDNLVKGAAGQAIQNMNLALDLPETMGLRP